MIEVEYDENIKWKDQASCIGMNSDDFFPTNINKKNIAVILEIKKVCNQCSVAANCLNEAVAYEHDGIWAGTTFKDRRVWMKFLKKQGVTKVTLEHCNDFLYNGIVEHSEIQQGEQNV